MSSLMRKPNHYVKPSTWIVTEGGSLPVDAVVGDPGCMVMTQRGSVPVKELDGSDVITVETKAYMIKGLVMKKEGEKQDV